MLETVHPVTGAILLHPMQTTVDLGRFAGDVQDAATGRVVPRRLWALLCRVSRGLGSQNTLVWLCRETDDDPSLEILQRGARFPAVPSEEGLFRQPTCAVRGLEDLGLAVEPLQFVTSMAACWQLRAQWLQTLPVVGPTILRQFLTLQGGDHHRALLHPLSYRAWAGIGMDQTLDVATRLRPHAVMEPSGWWVIQRPHNWGPYGWAFHPSWLDDAFVVCVAAVPVHPHGTGVPGTAGLSLFWPVRGGSVNLPEGSHLVTLVGDLRDLLADKNTTPALDATKLIARAKALHDSSTQMNLLALSLRLTECCPLEPMLDPETFRDTLTYMCELVAVHRRYGS